MGGEQQPQPDPTLVAETQQASVLDTQQVQNSLGQDQQNLWNMFGNGSQMSYIHLPNGQTAPAPPPGQTSLTTGAPTGPGANPSGPAK